YQSLRFRKISEVFLFSRRLVLCHADGFWVTQISQMTQIFDLFGLVFCRMGAASFTFLPFYFFTFISVLDFVNVYRFKIKKADQ
ncbi:hypothetical protein ACQRBO_12910, partial [Segatella copri]|uniref:hypothetical protein n=1 Tax=Segatella copri TaxID=165179 RepID=UPI003CFFB308